MTLFDFHTVLYFISIIMCGLMLLLVTFDLLRAEASGPIEESCIYLRTDAELQECVQICCCTCTLARILRRCHNKHLTGIYQTAQTESREQERAGEHKQP